jgi:hypothetical protein
VLPKFFRIHNEDIATVYDPPHLLKCTCNLFLKHDVHLKAEHVGNELAVIAKWNHILIHYELDKPIPFPSVVQADRHPPT